MSRGTSDEDAQQPGITNLKYKRRQQGMDYMRNELGQEAGPRTMWTKNGNEHEQRTKITREAARKKGLQHI